MQSIDGIDILWMSGARANFTLKAGLAFEEQTFATAFRERDLQLDTFAKRHLPRPQTMRRYLLHSGLG